MKIQFIPLDFSTFDYQGKNYIQLIGRTDKGKRVAVIDNYEANFWAILKKDLSTKKIQEIKENILDIKIESPSRVTKIEKVELHNKKFLGKDVQALRVFVTNHKDSHAIADQMGWPEIEKRREYDVPIISKYIIEKKISPFNFYEVEGQILNNSPEFGGIDSSLDVDICLKAEKISLSPDQPIFKPKILAFDIETDEFEIGKGKILMISLYGENFKKVLTWKSCNKSQDFVECFKDESEMLEAFVKYFKHYSPDILTGYFSDGFDLPYLRSRAEYNKIKLSLGIDNSQPSFSRGRITSGKIDGIVHLDLYRFIETAYSQYLQSETLSLNDVSKELLGEGKHDFDFAKMKKMTSEDWKDFFKYNLHDSELTFRLAEKAWPDLLEFSIIMQEPLFDVSRDGMSTNVENYILHNLEKFNEIAEKRPLHDEITLRQSRGKYEGAFVFQPKPGLYENLCFFDFTSYWPSIIITFNLSRSTFLESKEKDSLEVDVSGKKFYFSKKPGFFPEMLKEVIEKRKKYKKEYNENPDPFKKARSNAFKLLANASYGYQGFFGARYYCPEASAATTAISREFTKKTIDLINSKAYGVIYGDTDSIALKLNDHTKKETLELLKNINKDLPGIMELDLEDFYKRGLFVSKRTTKEGAKKKYALIDEKNKMKIRGFETVRRDWCTLARDLQNKVLEYTLIDGNETRALELIKTTIKNLKERKIDRKDIIIRTQLKKPLTEYKSITPHVVAAQKIEASGLPVTMGMLVEYFIAETREKKSLVRDKVKLPDEKGEYNIEYYLEHQIFPAIENILDVFNVNIQEITNGKKQSSLGEF